VRGAPRATCQVGYHRRVEGPNFEFATETREELYYDKEREREIAKMLELDAPYK
jgi:hypothetical protein